MINKKEIERVIDDIEAKIEELKEVRTNYIRIGMWIQADFSQEKIEGMEYCLAVIKQVLPNE